MGLVGDGDGYVWLERLGFSGFQWGWAMAMEIGVAVEIGVGLGFVFLGLVVGGVFLGFCRGRWSVVEVEIGMAMEIGVAMFVFRRWRCLGEFGFVFVVFFFFYVDLHVYFLDLLGLIS